MLAKSLYNACMHYNIDIEHCSMSMIISSLMLVRATDRKRGGITLLMEVRTDSVAKPVVGQKPTGQMPTGQKPTTLG